MADSGYFDGTVFRAIDSDATSDNSPLSSALEGQIANNIHFLHRFGGGSVNRAMGAKDVDNQYSQNHQTHISVVQSSIFFQPFLVTKGLKRIYVNWYGTCEFEDSDLEGSEVTLELVGFGQVTTTWDISTVNENQFRSIVLELELPSSVEIETDLILWARSTTDPTDDLGEYETYFMTSTNGWIYTDVPDGFTPTPVDPLSDLHTRSVRADIPTRGAGFTSSQIIESIYRDPDGSIGDLNDINMILAHEPIALGSVRVREVKTNVLTSRAISITVESE